MGKDCLNADGGIGNGQGSDFGDLAVSGDHQTVSDISSDVERDQTRSLAAIGEQWCAGRDRTAVAAMKQQLAGLCEISRSQLLKFHLLSNCEFAAGGTHQAAAVCDIAVKSELEEALQAVVSMVFSRSQGRGWERAADRPIELHQRPVRVSGDGMGCRQFYAGADHVAKRAALRL